MTNKELIEEIKINMVKKRESQRSLARKLGTSNSYISLMLTGKRIMTKKFMRQLYTVGVIDRIYKKVVTVEVNWDAES